MLNGLVSFSLVQSDRVDVRDVALANSLKARIESVELTIVRLSVSKETFRLCSRIRKSQNLCLPFSSLERRGIRAKKVVEDSRRCECDLEGELVALILQIMLL